MRFLIIWVVLVRSVFSIHCPEYCDCHMQDEYRYVGCVNKGLISIDLDVPTSVQWLQLTNNSIHFLKNHVFSVLELVHIQRLDLNRNSLNTIDHAAFEGMDLLEIVDLSSNHLYQIDPRTFELNPSLKRLDLSSNPLRTLPEPFLVSSSLENLYLKNINLGYLPPNAFIEMHSLRQIDLSSNQLIQFSTSSVERLSNLAQIYLSGNYIKCDRYTTLAEELKKIGIRLYGLDCPSQNKSKSLTPSITVQTNNSYRVHDKFQRMVMDPKMLDKPTVKSTKTELVSKYPSPVIITQSTTVKPMTELNVPKFNNYYSSWIIVIIFFTGFLLGVFVAYTSVGLHSLYWRCQKRRIRSNGRDLGNLNMSVVTRTTQEPLIRHTIMCPTSTDPFAPPPPYNQLFGTYPRSVNL